MARKAVASVSALRPNFQQARPQGIAPNIAPDIERDKVEQTRAWLNEHQIRRIRVGGLDIDGLFRGKIISVDKFLSTLKNGFGFCDVIFGWDSGDQLLDNLTFTGWHTGYPDTMARIDLETKRVLPWDPATALFLVDFWDRKTGAPLAVCPRQTLKRVLARLAGHDMTALAGYEYEFFFFKETAESIRAKNFRDLTPLSPGMFGYSVLRASENAALVNEVFDSLAGANIGIEGMHTETGPGVYECAIRYDDALRAADKAALFKTAVKEIAFRHGLMACFMAKFSPTLPGCSGHVHFSLWGDGENRLYAKEGLSQTARQAIGGLVRGLPDFMPLVAPTINSYKRTVPNTWAPTTATWGVENRTTAIRLIPGSEASTRLEFRIPGSDTNPYLVLAAALGMALQGCERDDVAPPVTGANAYEDGAAEPLPLSLEAATARFEKSERAREVLGAEFVAHFAATRHWEVRAYQRAVTDWELARYFECI